MEINSINLNDLEDITYNTHCFNNINFINLVKNKTDELLILLFKNSKKKLAIIFGVKDKIISSPFSAPFGGFIQLTSKITIEEIDESVECIINWLSKNNLNQIEITIPPLIYDISFLSKIESSLLRSGFELLKNELNYHFDLSHFDCDLFIDNNMQRNARKNFNIALKSNLNFKKVIGIEKEIAYQVILQNRTEKGYPLKLSYEDLINTEKYIEIDYFIVEFENIPIASAIVYKIDTGIMQVVYWGGIEKYQNYKPINFLSFNLLSFYSKNQIRIIDIGPSSVSSIPDYGLCDFKESIGCNVSLRKTFKYEIK